MKNRKKTILQSLSLALCVLFTCLTVSINNCFGFEDNLISAKAVIDGDNRTYVMYDVASAQTSTYTLSNDDMSNERIDLSRIILSGVPNGSYDDCYDTRIIKCSGTGFIVGKHVIATNAHCVYSSSTDEFNTTSSVVAYTYPNGTPTPHYLTITSLHYPQNYYVNNTINRDYDYGMIVVVEDLTSYGFFNLGIALDTIETGTNGKAVTVAGFPQNNANMIGGHRYKPLVSEGKLYGKTGYQLYHTCDTESGSSGSPVYTTKTFNYEEYDTVIGIHWGTPNGVTDHNQCVRITQPLLAFYYQFNS